MRFPLLGEEPEEEEMLLHCQINPNFRIDFCIWILEVDGLHVPPFNLHPEGDLTLQNQGLDAESWQAWLANVVATQDIRLQIDVENSQAKTTEHVSSLQDMMKQFVERGMTPQEYADQVDWSRIGSSYQRLLVEAEQEYQQAVEELGDLARNVTPAKAWKLTPPEVWNGAPEIGERLAELWQHYRATSNRSKCSLEQVDHLDSFRLSELQKYKENFDFLFIYLVYYPEPVEYLLPPNRIIVSITTELCDIEDLRVRTLRAVEHLIHLSN